MLFTRSKRSFFSFCVLVCIIFYGSTSVAFCAKSPARINSACMGFNDKLFLGGWKNAALYIQCGRLSGSNISIEWEKIFENPASGMVTAMDIDQDGNLFLIGNSQPKRTSAQPPRNSWGLIKIDGDGAEIYSKWFSGNFNIANSISVHEGANYVCGCDQDLSPGWKTPPGKPIKKGWIKKFNQYGLEITDGWNKYTPDNCILDVQIDAEGNVYAISEKDITKYSGNGDAMWSQPVIGKWKSSLFMSDGSLLVVSAYQEKDQSEKTDEYDPYADLSTDLKSTFLEIKHMNPSGKVLKDNWERKYLLPKGGSSSYRRRIFPIRNSKGNILIAVSINGYGMNCETDWIKVFHPSGKEMPKSWGTPLNFSASDLVELNNDTVLFISDCVGSEFQIRRYDFDGNELE